MILKESRELEWIQQLRTRYPYTNPTLIEKAIRAFSLLEALAVSGCPFVFKGGTALMLHMNSAKRISIDVDIICEPGTDVIGYLNKTAQDYGFGEVISGERVSRTNVPKTHAKCYYTVSYHTNPLLLAGEEEEKILLDVLFDEVEYHEMVKKPIESPFLQSDGNPVYVNMPSMMDILGDKMTAFAPNTTGIPYFKDEKRCSMEIIKQLFDVASIFDQTTDLEVARKTFSSIVPVELAYRDKQTLNERDVLNDILNVSRIICTWGYDDAFQYGELSDGVGRVRDFIHSERYNYDSAVVNASKAAYLAALTLAGKDEVLHFDPQVNLTGVTLSNAVDPKLKRLKKYRPEAFFYWSQVDTLLKL